MPTLVRLRRTNVTTHNERVPCQPQPVSPFRPKACAPDSRGYANVVCKPSITVPTTTGAPIMPSWVWKPAGRLQILALMSLEVAPPNLATTLPMKIICGCYSMHENRVNLVAKIATIS